MKCDICFVQEVATCTGCEIMSTYSASMESLHKYFKDACDDQEDGSLQTLEVNKVCELISTSFPSLQKDALTKCLETQPWGKSQPLHGKTCRCCVRHCIQ